MTGQERRDKQGSALDLANLANFPGTFVFYMGVTTAPVWAGELIKHGKRADTPVAIVRHCSLPAQRTVRTTLGELSAVLARGQNATTGDRYRRRRSHRAGREQLQLVFVATSIWPNGIGDASGGPGRRARRTIVGLGAATLLQPAITIEAADDWSHVDAAIEKLASYQWLVFSSANGVHYFLDRLLATGRDLRQLGQLPPGGDWPSDRGGPGRLPSASDLRPVQRTALNL